jgi:signal transduction histidine kinase
LEAIALYDSAAILKTKLNDEVGLSNTLYNLSDSYLKLQNPDKALALLKKAEYLCIKNGSESNNLTNIYASLCNLYFKKRQPDQMMLMLVKMKSLIDQHKDERNLKNYYTYLSDYYSLKNSYKDALLYYKKSDSIYNILEGIEVKNAIHLYETQYQTAKKEKELANAQLKITESKLLTKQKNIWLILLGFGILIVLIVFGIFREKATLKQQQLALENQLLKEQTLSKIQAQRLEISRDLHDSLGAQLTFMHTVLGGLKMIDQNMDNNLKNKINLLSDFSENSITELKNALWVLNAKEVSLEDLKIKILNFIKNASEAMDNVRFNFDAVITNNFILDSKLVVNLFRIIQEIVNNAMKYADASEVNINLYQKEKALIITISDNGNGFDYNKERDRSFGLKNIEGRVKTIQGKMDLQTTPGKGTHYTIQVPF